MSSIGLSFTDPNAFHRGKLRFVATFMKNTPVSTDGGLSYKSVFTNILTTRCQFFKETGQEVLANGQLYFNNTFTMRCAYKPVSELPIDIDTSISIRGPFFPASLYKIETWKIVDERAYLFEFKLSKSN